MPTKIETRILDGAVKAQKNYLNMTENWLDQAPESFINVHVGLSVAEGEYYANVDTSVKRLNIDIKKKGPNSGRKLHFEKERPDIAIWYKSRNELAAIVETKKAFNGGVLEKDLKKLKKHLNHRHSAKRGYLLVFTTSGKKSSDKADTAIVCDLLTDKLKRWGERLGIKLVASKICRPKDTWYNKNTGRHWGWAIGLYCYKP
jgi:hypothetical protein